MGPTSGTTALRFNYVVQAGDMDDNGIYLEADELELNGGTIKNAAGVDAVLTYTAEGQQNEHKVDGSIAQTDTTPPALDSATVEPDGTVITLVFDEPFNVIVLPGVASHPFSVTADGSAVTVGEHVVLPDEVITPLVYRTIQLKKLSSAITYGQVVTVSYTDPTTGDDTTAVIQDAAGNDVASFTTGSGGVPAVVNNVPPDGTPAIDIDAKDAVAVLEGHQARLEVRLRAMPSATVTVGVVSSNTGKVTVTPASLAFTTTNWDDYQELTITPADDPDSSDETVTLTLSGTGLTTTTVTVTVTDDDGGGGDGDGDDGEPEPVPALPLLGQLLLALGLGAAGARVMRRRPRVPPAA